MVHAQTLKLTGGVVDDQVLQRDASNRATATLSGTAERAEGRAVEVRVVRKFIVVETFGWHTISRVSGGKWSGQIQGLPVGPRGRVNCL